MGNVGKLSVKLMLTVLTNLMPDANIILWDICFHVQLISKQITHPCICSGLGNLALQLNRAMLFQHRHHQETSRYRSNSPHSHTSNRNRSESSTSRPSTYRSQETYHRNRTPHRTEDRAHHRHQTRSRSPLNLDKLDNIIDQLQEVRRKKTQ